MRSAPTYQTLRVLLALCAAGAISACAGGSQRVTPATGSGLSPASVSDHAALSSERDNGDGGDDNGGDGGAVVYNSIPNPVKAVASVGFEATTLAEFGDGVNLTHTGKLSRVRYVLSSWGCQNGRWNTGNCVTTGHPTFPMPITVNVYAYDALSATHVGPLLTTQTKTFNIPFRPSSDPVKCDAQRFFSAVDNACVHGLANVISFSFGAPRATLPAKTIVSLAYNTTHYGYHPIGESAPCFASSPGCGYDALNVSADGNGGPVGSPVDPNGVFDYFVQPSQYCVPTATSSFRLDAAPACWTTNHPQFEVRVTGGEGEHRDRESD